MVNFRVHIPADHPRTAEAAVEARGELPEYGQVWVWDMLYARIMHSLAGRPEADELRERLELWAVNMSSKIYQPYEHVRAKGHTRIDEHLRLTEAPPPRALAFEVQVSGGAEELPAVEVLVPEGAEARHRAAVAVALGQYFIEHNKLFAKELPLHVLAFRKYYTDLRGPEEEASLEEAPLYAIQKALEYFNSVARGTMQ